MARTRRSDRRHQDNLDPKIRSEIGRKGGQAVSRDHEHMAAIGRKGGKNSHRGRK